MAYQVFDQGRNHGAECQGHNHGDRQTDDVAAQNEEFELIS